MINYNKDGVNKDFTEEQVVKIVKQAVLDYFGINLTQLAEHTRAHTSSYPRKLYWYFLRCVFDISHGLCRKFTELPTETPFDSGAVTIQSQTALLQAQYNKEMKYDIQKIQERIDKLMFLWDGD